MIHVAAWSDSICSGSHSWYAEHNMGSSTILCIANDLQEFPAPGSCCEHDAAPAGRADEHRLADQLGVVELLDGRVEGVHVGVNDGAWPARAHERQRLPRWASGGVRGAPAEKQLEQRPGRWPMGRLPMGRLDVVTTIGKSVVLAPTLSR